MIDRPATELADICRQLPDLWRQACVDVSHTCLPRVILEPNLPAEVTVRLDGRSTSLPNIHRDLLLLTHLQPGRQRGVGAPAVFCPLTVVVVVVEMVAVVVPSIESFAAAIVVKCCAAVKWSAALAMGVFVNICEWRLESTRLRGASTCCKYL